ncbi:transmembrane protease serine 9-like [Anopheles moucheti]|uniref:transmembrane protease serine 9-like n=1 Tax=Anopheles moucheti TaxID=186751 RepID=UPI0022F1431F|nr:transmembrane protease serine 9-like [Anopheles moucheti]
MMVTLKSYLFFATVGFLLIEAVDLSDTTEPGAFCVNPAGEPGKCIPTRNCEVLLHVVGKAIVSTKEKLFLLKSRCGTHESRPLVCCAGPPPDEGLELPSPPGCGIRSSSILIGGQLTQIDDFPWTALIEYAKPDGSYGFHCGGTLISQGHIVTAAHCVSSLPTGWKVNRVRLGEWDISAIEDCEHDYCNNPVIDVNISKIIVHDGYDLRGNSFSNDIALIRFKEQVNFSNTVQPICLPLSESIRSENVTGSFSTVAGWGSTPRVSGAAKKLQVDLNLRNTQQCSSILEQRGTGFPPLAQLCALGERSNREICSVDAGGGLVRVFYGFYYLIGIAGLVKEKCGSADVPGVYTEVSAYVDWIKQNINSIGNIMARSQLYRWLLSLCVLTTVNVAEALDRGQSCVNPVGKPGTCMPFRECPPLMAIYRKPITTPDESRFLANSRCGEIDRRTLVCCATADFSETINNDLPVPPRCGIQLSDRVVGGQTTELEEFPWSALIQYWRSEGFYEFSCGGTLINARYILTAAHCVKFLPQGWQVSKVRLGEWDLATENDCLNGVCSPSPIDLAVENIIAHSDYTGKNTSHINDIALMRLEQDVPSSSTIRPICLPVMDSVRNLNWIGMSSFAVGWGKTETALASEKKLKVELKVRDLTNCLQAYSGNGIYLKPSQMCAGGVRGKDTCTGDSGGPLMAKVKGAWYLIGVVSFGANKCGTAGYPGIYTNVAMHMDWIESNIQ